MAASAWLWLLLLLLLVCALLVCAPPPPPPPPLALLAAAAASAACSPLACCAASSSAMVCGVPGGTCGGLRAREGRTRADDGAALRAAVHAAAAGLRTQLPARHAPHARTHAHSARASRRTCAPPLPPCRTGARPRWPTPSPSRFA
jgi:hypothetical protein